MSRRSVQCAVAAIAAFAIGASAVPAARAQTPSVVSPEVVHTGAGPTGYTVTFRVYDPTATRIRIKGEWFFSSAADSSYSPPASAGRLPSQWQPGDFPIANPNATDANWPVADMTKDDATGVWSYTTPLPSGVFTYALYRNCDAAAPALTGCTATSDPSNPPFNTRGSVEANSQVYVPSDPAFGTVDYSWQAPPAGPRGTLADISYPSAQSSNPVGSHDMVVYLPPGYDADRATPYPLFVISHGGGGNEVDWATQGALGPIADNLIDAGRIQPAVIVSTNGNGISGGTAGYALELRNSVVPYMQSHYNVAAAAAGRAFAGLSAGGARANELLFNNTTFFGYMGVWSCCNNGSIRPPGDPIYANPDLKRLLGLHLSIGAQDPVNTFMNDEFAGLAAAGVPYVSYKPDGGHEWFTWRQALRDYLTRVAFRATTTSVTTGAGALRVTVAPATAEPAVPSGTVQAYDGGTPIGSPIALAGGKATIPVPSAASGSVRVAYSGDALYNASAGPATAYAASSTSGTVGGNVASTLSLTLAGPAAFGAFTPGVDKTYSTQTTASVTSTAGDATLSSSAVHLSNGAFTLADPLQVTPSKASWSGPVSNDPLTIAFSQHIGADEALRTGAYAATVTFTLSTTNP